jgi:hypothetical protein
MRFVGLALGDVDGRPDESEDVSGHVPQRLDAKIEPPGPRIIIVSNGDLAILRIAGGERFQLECNDGVPAHLGQDVLVGLADNVLDGTSGQGIADWRSWVKTVTLDSRKAAS